MWTKQQIWIVQKFNVFMEDFNDKYYKIHAKSSINFFTLVESL